MIEDATPIGQFRFTGHETFPLRLLWLKKAYDAVARGADRRTFQDQSAIALFGVGKNMALSMRHWALATGMIAETGSEVSPTRIAKLLFDDRDGLDPYLESHSTLWLIHSRLAGRRDVATTFYFAFNLLNQLTFTRDDLIGAVHQLARTAQTRATVETIKRDVEVFVRSYSTRGGEVGEDAAEPLLAELGLLRETRSTGQIEFVRGPKRTLTNEIFALALKRYWMTNHPQSPTLSVEQLNYGEGSPGRVFKLDEDSLVARLMRISEATHGAIEWSDTAGLRQIALAKDIATIDDEELLCSSYRNAA